MILTVRFLHEMFRQCGESIDVPLEEYLLATFEEEPFPHEWSEQDLFEQVPKIITQYKYGSLDINIPAPMERQKLRFEELKESYIEQLREVFKLRETINSAAKILVLIKHPTMSVESSYINF